MIDLAVEVIFLHEERMKPLLDGTLETGLFIRSVWLLLLITEICMDAYVTLSGRIAKDALGRARQRGSCAVM